MKLFSRFIRLFKGKDVIELEVKQRPMPRHISNPKAEHLRTTRRSSF